MKKLLFPLLLLLSFASNAFEIHAHRGGSDLFEENSLAALQDGLDKGATTVEFDIHLTKDNKLVVTHDPVINLKKCESPLKGQLGSNIIRNLTAQEVTSFSCQHRSELTREPIALFSQVLRDIELAEGQRLNIEIKHYDSINKSEYSKNLYKELYPTEKAIIDTLKKELEVNNFSKEKYLIQSFSTEVLKEAKKQIQGVTTSYLYKGKYTVVSLPGVIALFTKSKCADICWVPNYKKALEAMKEGGFDYFAPNFKQLSHPLYKKKFFKYIGRAHKKGNFKLLPWTINDEAQMNDAIENYNVDGIITDYPEMLVE